MAQAGRRASPPPSPRGRGRQATRCRRSRMLRTGRARERQAVLRPYSGLLERLFGAGRWARDGGGGSPPRFPRSARAGRVAAARRVLGGCRASAGRTGALVVRAASGGARHVFVCTGARRAAAAGSSAGGGRGAAGGRGGGSQARPHPSLQPPERTRWLAGPGLFPGLGVGWAAGGGCSEGPSESSRQDREAEAAFRQAGKSSGVQNLPPEFTEEEPQGNFGQPRPRLRALPGEPRTPLAWLPRCKNWWPEKQS